MLSFSRLQVYCTVQDSSSLQILFPAGSSSAPTIQATVNATLTFTSLPSSTAPNSNLAALVAADISAYVGGSQPLVSVTVDTSGPDLAINISAVYPTNAQISGADPIVPASLQVRCFCLVWIANGL